MESNALKALGKTDDELTVGNYIVLFGGRDLEFLRSGKNADGSLGEFFTPDTDLESSFTKAGVIPVDWEHGEGKTVDGQGAPGKDDILGRVNWKSARRDERGVWVERVLDRRNQYVKMLEQLIDAGLIGTSSEAVETQIKRKKTGEITAWPLMRDTLTVTPMEPRMLTENVLQSVKALSDRIPGLKALLPQGEPETPAGGDPAEGETAEYQNLQLQAKALVFALDAE